MPVVVAVLLMVSGCGKASAPGSQQNAADESTPRSAAPDSAGSAQASADTQTGSEPNDEPMSSAKPGELRERQPALCQREFLCADSEVAADWFGAAHTYRHPSADSFVETLVVMTTGGGLRADPRAASSVLLAMYVPSTVDPASLATIEDVYSAGSIIIQMKRGEGSRSNAPPAGGDLNRDGYSSEPITVNGREGILVVTQSPPLSTSRIFIEWEVTLPDDERLFVNVVADSEKASKAEMMRFASSVQGP